MPADNARAHEKATGLAADALIFDLEDAVAPAHKASARDQLAQSAARHDYGRRALFLRMNHPEDAHAREDIALLADLPYFSGVVIPKVEDAATIHRVASWMDELGCPDKQEILIMLETPLGIIQAASFTQNQPRLSGIIAGTNDLAAAMRLPTQPARFGLLHALSQIVLVARSFGLQAYDGVFNRLRDAEGFERECAEGRELGFDGKTLIHPAQIPAANAAFSPSAEETAAAAALVQAWETQHKGVTTADGAMIEALHVDNARRILALDKANRQET